MRTRKIKFQNKDSLACTEHWNRQSQKCRQYLLQAGTMFEIDRVCRRDPPSFGYRRTWRLGVGWRARAETGPSAFLFRRQKMGS